MSNELLVSLYENQTSKICSNKKRHWLFLLVLAILYFYVANNAGFFPTYCVAALFLTAMIWFGSTKLDDTRVQLAKIYQEYRKRDGSLGSLITPGVTKRDLGDHLMHFSGLYAPLLSIAVLNPAYLPHVIFGIYAIALVDLFQSENRPGDPDETEDVYYWPFIIVSALLPFWM